MTIQAVRLALAGNVGSRFFRVFIITIHDLLDAFNFFRRPVAAQFERLLVVEQSIFKAIGMVF
jgi:hypothetical protein